MEFFEVDQNNSGGKFKFNDKLCARLIIEAKDEKDAKEKAENLGCYWNGVDDGLDCSCCGDRWYPPYGGVKLEQYKEKGWEAYVYCFEKNIVKRVLAKKDAVIEWNKKYGDLPKHTKPKWQDRHGTPTYTGKIYFKNIEQYAQFMADTYGGHTSPDVRIFYANGVVKDIYRR